MAIINTPPLSSVDAMNDDGTLSDVNAEWRQFFQAVYLVCFSVQQSGTTANRPTKFLWTGRPYFDTTLGKPVWYKTAGWVDATGAPV